MNSIDILLAVFVLVPTLLGLWRGMLWPISVLLGFIVGGLAAVIFAPPLAAALMPASGWAPLAAAASLFVLGFLAVQLTRWGLRRLLAAIGLKWLDHLAGGLASGAVAAVVGAWIVTAVPSFLAEKPRPYETSLLAPHAETIACLTGLPCGGNGAHSPSNQPNISGLLSTVHGLSLGSIGKLDPNSDGPGDALPEPPRSRPVDSALASIVAVVDALRERIKSPAAPVLDEDC